jgi:hypothetical protein
MSFIFLFRWLLKKCGNLFVAVFWNGGWEKWTIQWQFWRHIQQLIVIIMSDQELVSHAVWNKWILEAVHKVWNQKKRSLVERICRAVCQHHNFSQDMIADNLEHAVRRGSVLQVLYKGENSYKDTGTVQNWKLNVTGGWYESSSHTVSQQIWYSTKYCYHHTDMLLGYILWGCNIRCCWNIYGTVAPDITGVQTVRLWL